METKDPICDPYPGFGPMMLILESDVDIGIGCLGHPWHKERSKQGRESGC
jgi:hypothetical protein